MDLTVLGSGSAFSGAGHNAAYLVDGRLLLDCGAPVNPLLVASQRRAEEVQAILVSHEHNDHIGNLPLFLASRVANFPDADKVRILGPVGFDSYLRQVSELTMGDFLWPMMRDSFQVEECRDGDEAEVAGYRVRAYTVEHSPRMNCLAFRIDDGRTSLGYSGDTTFCSGIRQLASNVDFLLCECTGMRQPVPVHLWRGEVEQLMAESPSTRFILTHLEERQPVPGAVLASDGITLKLLRTAPD